MGRALGECLGVQRAELLSRFCELLLAELQAEVVAMSFAYALGLVCVLRSDVALPICSAGGHCAAQVKSAAAPSPTPRREEAYDRLLRDAFRGVRTKPVSAFAIDQPPPKQPPFAAAAAHSGDCMRPQGSHSPRHRQSAAARRHRAATAPETGQPVWYHPPSPERMPIARDDPPPAPPTTDAETDQYWEENKGDATTDSAVFKTARDEAPTAPSRPLKRTGSGEVEFEIVASPHAKIGNEGRSEEQREALRREHERLCELDRIARQQRLEAEAERDRIEEERRRRDAARPLHQGQRITNRGRQTRQLVSAPGDAFSDVRGPPPPVRRVAPPAPPPRSPAKKGDVAWHLHQALEAALTENEKLKNELARYKAAYGELPRDGRRSFR